MTAAQPAAHRFAPEAPELPATRGTAQAALLSLLLHAAALAAIAGVALQPRTPQGEAVFTIELVTSATAAAGSSQATAEPVMAEAAKAPSSADAARPSPEEQTVQAEQPVQAAHAEPDAVPLPPEPTADIAAAPVPEAKPKSTPRPPLRAMTESKPATPPAAQAAHLHAETAAAPQPAAPAASFQPAGQLGAETQRASAAAGSSDELPVITEPRFRTPPRPPEYPPRARAMEQQGVSVVRALVDTDGTSREIRLWRSSGFDALDRAALLAVRGWRFEAARRGEQPVLAWVEIPIRFEIR